MHLFDKTTTHQKWPLLALPSITKTKKKILVLRFYYEKKNRACFWIPPRCPDVTENILELG